LSDPRVLQRLRDGVRQAQRTLAQPALAAYGKERSASADAHSDDQLKHWIRQHTDTVYHSVGTCRMGQDGMAVVDAQLRVHGGPARGRCLGHAAHRERQHTCADDHDCREGCGLDTRSALMFFVNSMWMRSLVFCCSLQCRASEKR
jgi:hypothetical protein